VPGKKFLNAISFRPSGCLIGLADHVFFVTCKKFESNRVGSNTPPIRSNRILISLYSIRTDIKCPNSIRFDSIGALVLARKYAVSAPF